MLQARYRRAELVLWPDSYIQSNSSQQRSPRAVRIWVKDTGNTSDIHNICYSAFIVLFQNCCHPFSINIFLCSLNNIREPPWINTENNPRFYGVKEKMVHILCMYLFIFKKIIYQLSIQIRLSR